MNIFRTMNQKIHQRDYLDIDVQNIEVSMGHWGNEKAIRALAERVDVATIDANDTEFEDRLLSIFLDLTKENDKMEKILFHNDLKCLIVSNMRTFSPENFFKRSIEISHNKANKKVIINEITLKELEEIQDGKKSLPTDWVENKDLSNKFETYRSLFLT